MVATQPVPVPAEADPDWSAAKRLHRRQLNAQQPQGHGSAGGFESTKHAYEEWDAGVEDDGLQVRRRVVVPYPCYPPSGLVACARALHGRCQGAAWVFPTPCSC